MTTWFTDRLSAVIFSFESSTWIWRRRPPLTVTAATPSTRSKRGADLVLRDLAQRHRVVVALDAELHDRQRFESNLKIVGGSASSGSRFAHAIDARAHFVGGFGEV